MALTYEQKRNIICYIVAIFLLGFMCLGLWSLSQDYHIELHNPVTFSTNK